MKIGFLSSIAAAGVLVATGALADSQPITLPAPSSQTSGGPNTNQEASAVNGPRADDPYYQPKGIPLGSDGTPWRLFPNLYADVGYDDNVYRSTGSGKVSSAIFEADPTLILDYDINRARVDLYAQGGFQSLSQYQLYTYNTGIQGEYEISHDAAVSLSASDGLFYEDYASADTFSQEKRPNEYQLFDVSGKANFKPNRLGFTVGGSYDAYDYTSTPLMDGTLVNFHFRNAQIAKGWGEASYDFSPGYSAFVKATYNNDDQVDTTRSSNGYSVDAGVDLLLGNLAQGEAYIGYLTQDYKAPFKDISGLDFGANLTWYPTELLTVKLAGSRQLENTTVTNAGAGDDKSGSLTADYELLRTLHLNATVGYDDTNYAGSIPVRDDKSFSAGAGAKWLLTHYVWLDAHYTYTNRSSTVLAGRYVDNLVSIGLNLQD
jgi:hypothetical protein